MMCPTGLCFSLLLLTAEAAPAGPSRPADKLLLGAYGGLVSGGGNGITADLVTKHGFDWVWLILALIADIASWGIGSERRRLPGYDYDY